jgi:hypothetical protein
MHELGKLGRVMPDLGASRIAHQRREMHLDTEPFDTLAVDRNPLSSLRSVLGE